MDRFRLAVFNTQPPHLYFGGVERRIVETTRRLQNDADISVYCGTKAGFKAPTALDKVNVIPINSTDRLYPLDNWTFNRSLTKQASAINANADLYEAHAVSGYSFAKALKKQGITKPFIHTIHGVLADEYQQAKASGYHTVRDRVANYFMRYLAGLESDTAKKSTLIVTISKYSLEKIQSCYGIDSGKVRIVPNGVDIDKFKPAADVVAAKRKFGFGDAPCVLFVGSLIPRKGLPLLVEAAKTVIKQQPKTRFVLVGDGPLKNQLTASLQNVGLLNNFTFIGKVSEEDLAVLYNCADVFVLPSIQEGQGIVLLEAQASGVPVVAFDIGGVNEAVHNAETGLLVERGNIIALAEALLKVLGDAGLRQKLGSNGRRFVSENLTWDLCAKRMLAVYREALGQ